MIYREFARDGGNFDTIVSAGARELCLGQRRYLSEGPSGVIPGGRSLF